VLELAPTPGRGRGLSRSKIASALRRAGRQRNVDSRAEQIQTALRAPQLEQPALIAEAFGATVRAYVTLLATSVGQIRSLEGQLEESFGQHPAAEIVLSQPGLGTILGARVLAEFGDDPHRYASPKSRKNYAGTAPITRPSGTRQVVLARVATNKRLRDALHLQAFTALNTRPGARAYYDARRADGHTHHQALRAVSNRLVGILHGCLRPGTRYDENDRLAPLPTRAGPSSRLTS
jgi:transposase